MPRYIALLRGINVSGQKLIQMERLRAAFETLGFGDVKTYLQSGNVVFTAGKISEAALVKKIAQKILADFGHEVSVLVRTPEELGEVVGRNPLLQQAGVDEGRLYVTFLPGPAPEETEERLKPLAAKADRFAVLAREIYLFCPGGYGTTKFSNNAVEKKLSLKATTRNWRTVNALLTMAKAGDSP